MNKRWELDNGIYKLYFTQFYEEELIAELQYSEDEDDWLCSINLYKNKQDEWLGDSDLTANGAKELVEDMIEQYMINEIDYYKDMLEKFVAK